MANTKKISLFWEEKQITLLEVDRNQPVQSHVIDLNAIYSEAAFSAGLTEEIQTVALIQKTLRELRIEAADTSLALCNRDVILRSFVIPALKTNEIQTAVQFEAKKYIPFDINELRYTFHSIPFTENKTKRLRVTLYAVRKETLDKYERIIKQTGLNLLTCEPAAVGLCRTMLYQKDITLDARVAILDINDQNGCIYFIDRGIAVFIREFQLSVATVNVLDPAEEAELIKSRIFNEIRNSFDFFNRQHSEQVNQLLIYGNDKFSEIIHEFADELGVNVRRYSANLISPLKTFSGIALISSYGLLIPPVAGGAPVSDLLIKQKSTKDSASKSSAISINIDLKEFAPVINVAIGAAVCCAAFFGYLYFQQQELNKQIDALSSQQGEFTADTTDTIQGKITKFNTDEDAIKKVRLKTDLNVLTALIAQYVPEGMWLDGLDVKFAGEDDNTVNLNFKGNVYLPDVNMQIKTVNTFLAKLRQDKEISKYFHKVQLQSIQRQENNKVTSTVFEVRCF